MVRKSNKKEEKTRWEHRWSISVELEIYKISSQMDILGFRNTVSEIKSSLTELHGRRGKQKLRLMNSKLD